ncbi:MAG: Uma2 family endonuclease [Acidobacteria bacterium]|nr:Uma2 family endonuclease [Acidobacteriota bacterium]MCA1637600.1 Uma2 family endonuclease [Acidobacteriota bacterium]
MSAVLEKPVINEFGIARFVLQFSPFLEMNDEQFFEFCQINRDLRIERNAQGEIIIMPPTGWETGDKNAEITTQLRNWTKKDERGRTADSSAGYKMPNGATVSPDASWILKERLEKVAPNKRRKFLPLAPDFVIELRSESDSLSKLKAKMQEYIENKVSLGWLIDPLERKVYVYRPNEEIKILENPVKVSGEPLLKGFTLNLKEIWD